MSTPGPGNPAPPPEPGRPSADDDQGRSTPWESTPWGAAPWSGPPAPSGYEAQLPTDGTASGTGTASPYAVPAGTTGGHDAAGSGASPYAAGEHPVDPGLAGQHPAGQRPAPASSASPHPAAPYPASPYPASPYPATYPVPPYPYGGYPAWTPPAPQQTDGLAIASLIVSCSSFVVGLSAPVGLGLGIAALRRIRRTGAQGRGLAIAGIVIGGLMTAAAVAMVALFVAFAIGMSTMAPAWDPASSNSGSSTDSDIPSYVLRTDVVPGDCLLDAPGTYDLSDAVVVDCAEPHGAEVLSTLAMSTPVLEDLEGWDPAYSDLAERCAVDAAGLLGATPVEQVGWSEVFYPHPDEWADGGRTAYCVLGTTGTVTGSAATGTFSDGTGTAT